MLRNDPIGRLVEDLRPSVVDVGARGGPDADLLAVAWASCVYAFEPEPSEAARLTRLSQPRWKEVHVLPCAVGGAVGRATLFVPASASAASLLKHNIAMVDRFGNPDLHIPRREIPVEVVTLDELFASRRLPSMDYLKLDIEGAELEVLKSAGSLLAACSAVKVECSFLPQRTGQPLIWEVALFLIAAGFEIVDLQDIHRWRRRPLPAHPYVTSHEMAYSKGLLAQCDVLAIRRPGTVIDPQKLSMLVVVSCALGYFDYAIGMIRETPALSESVRTAYGFDLELQLRKWSRMSGAAALRVAIRRQVRDLIPQFRSLSGRLPWGKPSEPY